MNEIIEFVCERKVKLPNRGTPYSAGIDFYVPEDLTDHEMYKLYSKNLSKGEEFARAYMPICSIDQDGKIIKFIIKPGQSLFIPTGIRVKIPHNHILKFENKSGVSSKKGLLVGASIVDEDYTGIIHINLWNANDEPVEVFAGDKIVQAILYPVVLAGLNQVSDKAELYKDFKTERGDGGFGSTGTK